MTLGALAPHLEAAVAEIEASGAEPLARAESLVEIAFNLLQRPRSIDDLRDAHELYTRAERWAAAAPLARARAAAGRGEVLRRIPGEGTETLEAARDAIAGALEVLREAGEDEEIAEAEMSLGLVVHALANAGLASMRDAIAAYQRSLRVFTAGAHPREHATLHNNLATAYLSMRVGGDREGLREALAVQSFQEALQVVSFETDPHEFAMLQNNLGNALQAVHSAHRFENLLRAVEAYDEALRVRTRRATPVEYANTIANKANALMNLPDDPERPERGNPKRLRQAAELLEEAAEIFRAHGVGGRADVVEGLARELRADLP